MLLHGIADHSAQLFWVDRFWGSEGKNTRAAYGEAVTQFFRWCEARRLDLERINPTIVAAYIEQHPGSPPRVKQHLAAIRMLFDWLVVGQIVPSNPASSVRGPKYVVKQGKTPVLKSDQARTLLDSIDTSTIVGLRDRALLGLMCYTFARVSAVVHMKVEDYYQNGKRWWQPPFVFSRLRKSRLRRLPKCRPWALGMTRSTLGWRA